MLRFTNEQLATNKKTIEKLATENKYVETPLMKQYNAIKEKHPDAVLLFRVGDFYETFGEDAIRASAVLGITLTKRANGAASYIELAGFPYHAIDTYMPKLVKAGIRVAICEQMEDPKTTKKIVKRAVTELVTPGVSFNDSVVLNLENNYVAAVYFGSKSIGVSFLDITTGEFYLAEGTSDYIDKLLVNFAPKEVLYQRGCKEQFTSTFGDKYYIYQLEQWIFALNSATDKLKALFGVSSLKGFGIEALSNGIVSAGAILYYLEFTEHRNTKHITKISRIDQNKYVWLDKYTLKNLEIFNPSSEGGISLVQTIDSTKTAMGGRLLRRWMSLPLKDVGEISKRSSSTTHLINDQALHIQLTEYLKAVGDIERLISKVSVGRVNPREVVALKNSFRAIQKIGKCCLESSYAVAKKWGEGIDGCKELADTIEQTILEEPSNAIQKGGVIAKNISAELDTLRAMSKGGKDYLINMQQRLSAETGITSLKIAFNNVFGYYIEVRNTHKDKTPESWIRKQTLAGAERYITAELKEYEEKILGAEDRIMALETELYNALIEEIACSTAKVQQDASIISHIDVICSFASTAKENKYCCPKVTTEDIIDIKQGRHPVIEKLMPIGQPYIPNDIYLDDKEQRIIIITGPNMSGKSALLRQCGLITIMAQIGSHVPAQSAEIGVADKIFTRVGASDNISQGESTFMVEMLESANILNNITSRSLVLLDEIGRGTSTYDGISIAWAMVEYLQQHAGTGSRTLFATHYHELNELEALYPRIKNFNVEVKEINNRVIFLRKLIPGGTEHSFGIHVARMAGMPKGVVARATEVLSTLEHRRDGGSSNGENVSGFKHVDNLNDDNEPIQLSLFQLDDPLIADVREKLENTNLDAMTPLEALNKLSEIKRLMGIDKK